jgi:hypothetical protein
VTFSIRIQSGKKEPIAVLILNQSGQELTGKTDIKIKIRRISDGFYLDWSDNTFKSAVSVVILLQVLQEISALYSPGEYQLNKPGHINGFDTLTITNPNSDDTYYVTGIQDGGVDASNVPMVGELKVGDYVDDIVEDRLPVVW